ncbi:hypothetical protein C8J56DRAFT_962537, partial [Mycena floridula]
LHRSNDMLSPEYISAIRVNVVRRKIELEDLEDQISTLDYALGRLQVRADEVKQAVEKDKALLHPMRRMPAELLRRIFSIYMQPTETPQCLSTGTLSNLRLSLSITDIDIRNHPTEQIPCHLSLVCQRWRDIVASFPEIWTNVSLRRSIPKAPVLANILQSSRSFPIDITLFHGMVESTSDIATTLFPTSQR